MHEESRCPSISFGNQPLATHATQAPKGLAQTGTKLKRHEPHHGAQIPHAQANRTESKPQVVRCPYFCPLFLSAAANQPPVAFSAANGVLPSFIHSLITSNNSTTFIEHLYILTLMDISFCAGLFRSLKDHHARGGSRKLKRARSRGGGLI